MDFLCREHSSVGLERLLDKQEVCGSNPHVPTSFEAFVRRFGQRLFFRRSSLEKGRLPQRTAANAAAENPPRAAAARRAENPSRAITPRRTTALPARRTPTRTASQNAQPVARQERSVRRKERIGCRPPQQQPISAKRRAPHPDTHRIPKRPAGCAARTFGSSEGADRCRASRNPFPTAPSQARRRSPPRTPSLCGTPCVYASTASRKRESPCFSAEAFGEKLGRDDWIRTSDNTPPRRVL